MRLAYFDQKLVYFNTWNPPLPNRTNPCSVAAILRKHRSAGKRCRLTVNHSLRSLLNRSFVTISFRKLCFAASQIINRFANGPPHSRRFKAVQPIRCRQTPEHASDCLVSFVPLCLTIRRCIFAIVGGMARLHGGMPLFQD